MTASVDTQLFLCTVVPIILFIRSSAVLFVSAVFVRVILFSSGQCCFRLDRFPRVFVFFQILVVILIVMDSDPECDRSSVSKASKTRMREVRTRKR